MITCSSSHCTTSRRFFTKILTVSQKVKRYSEPRKTCIEKKLPPVSRNTTAPNGRANRNETELTTKPYDEDEDENSTPIKPRKKLASVDFGKLSSCHSLPHPNSFKKRKTPRKKREKQVTYEQSKVDNHLKKLVKKNKLLLREDKMAWNKIDAKEVDILTSSKDDKTTSLSNEIFTQSNDSITLSDNDTAWSNHYLLSLGQISSKSISNNLIAMNHNKSVSWIDNGSTTVDNGNILLPCEAYDRNLISFGCDTFPVNDGDKIPDDCNLSQHHSDSEWNANNCSSSDDILASIDNNTTIPSCGRRFIDSNLTTVCPARLPNEDKDFNVALDSDGERWMDSFWKPQKKNEE